MNTKEIGVYKYEATEDPDMMKVEKIDIDIKESGENGSIIYIIPKLEKGQTINIEIKMKADKLDKNVYEKEISYNEVISINEMEDYTLRKDDIIIKPNYEISFSSENLTDSSRNTYVNPGDEISYTLNIKNNIVPFLVSLSILYIVNKYFANNFYNTMFLYKFFPYICGGFIIVLLVLASIKKLYKSKA